MLLDLRVVVDLEVVGRVDVPLEVVVVDVVLAEVRHERRLRATATPRGRQTARAASRTAIGETTRTRVRIGGTSEGPSNRTSTVDCDLTVDAAARLQTRDPLRSRANAAPPSRDCPRPSARSCSPLAATRGAAPGINEARRGYSPGAAMRMRRESMSPTSQRPRRRERRRRSRPRRWRRSTACTGRRCG